MRFEGILTFVETPSDKSPCGARGHSVILNRDFVESSIPSLIGMGIYCRTTDWKHAPMWAKNRPADIGFITGVKLEDKAVIVYGELDEDCEAIEAIAKQGCDLGMSYEIRDAHIEDMKAIDWRITRFKWSQAAIIMKEKAAYKNTSFKLIQE